MKILHVILIMYIIGLQALPCADQLESCDIEQHAHDSPSHSEEDCSPFCSCHCCRTQMISIENMMGPLNEHTSRIKLTPTPFEFVTQESQNSIWQPPKKC